MLFFACAVLLVYVIFLVRVRFFVTSLLQKVLAFFVALLYAYYAMLILSLRRL